MTAIPYYAMVMNEAVMSGKSAAVWQHNNTVKNATLVIGQQAAWQPAWHMSQPNTAIKTKARHSMRQCVKNKIYAQVEQVGRNCYCNCSDAPFQLSYQVLHRLKCVLC